MKFKLEMRRNRSSPRNLCPPRVRTTRSGRKNAKTWRISNNFQNYQNYFLHFFVPEKILFSTNPGHKKTLQFSTKNKLQGESQRSSKRCRMLLFVTGKSSSSTWAIFDGNDFVLSFFRTFWLQVRTQISPKQNCKIAMQKGKAYSIYGQIFILSYFCIKW